MVQGEDRHGRVEGAVREGEVFRRASDAVRAGMLAQHDGAGIDGHNGAVAGLVAPRSGTDVDDAARVAQRGVDPGGDPRIWPAVSAIADADGVVAIQ